MRKSHLRVLLIVGLLLPGHGFSWAQAYIWSSELPDSPSASSSLDGSVAEGGGASVAAMQDDRKYRGRVTQLPLDNWWHHPGVSVAIGINGVGVDVAAALRQRINVRIGAEFLRYTGQFTEENAQVDVHLRLGGGHAGVDLFPFERSSFHISPQLRFGILTRGLATVLIPPGQVISFNNSDYTSSSTDPLHGTAYLDTRKIAPGIAVGFGNLVPRARYQHWSFPVEVGVYYIGQPNVQISFSGSACSSDPSKGIGCDDVTKDAGFQSDLARFIARQQHNVSYASLFPILSFGVGYRF